MCLLVLIKRLLSANLTSTPRGLSYQLRERAGKITMVTFLNLVRVFKKRFRVNDRLG